MQEQARPPDEETVLVKSISNNNADLLIQIESCTSPEELKELLYSLFWEIQGKK